MHHPASRLALGALALALSVAAHARDAAAQTFTNPTLIGIPSFGPATPYPSAITVSGLGGGVTPLSVTLRGLSHTWPDDLEITVVAPTNQALILMNDQGGDADATAANFTFADGFAAVPDVSPTGSGPFGPRGGTPSAYAGTLPGGLTFVSSFAAFTGDLNGEWRLYVNDDFTVDGGEIANGWSITFASSTIPEPGTWALLGTGLVGLGLVARRRTSVG